MQQRLQLTGRAVETVIGRSRGAHLPRYSSCMLMQQLLQQRTLAVG
jgi:hypothetical protein